MLQVTSTLHIRDGELDHALELAQRHVDRSRREDGCLRHEVFQSPADPNTLFFFERWRDRAALDAHFAQAESIEFVQSLTALIDGSPRLEICSVSSPRTVSIGGLQSHS